MGTQQQGPLSTFTLMLATVLVTAALAIGSTPEPVPVDPQPPLEATVPSNVPDPAAPPAGDQKKIVEPSKNGNGKNGKTEERKKSRLAGMLLGIFAVIASQGPAN